MTVPALHPDGAEEELNRFLRSVRVVSVNRELIVDHRNSFWSFVVEYLMDHKTAPATIPDTGNKRMDYKDVLSPEDFTLFVKLRDWRKEVSTREAVPVYTVFTNAQLAEMVEKKVKTLAQLKMIEGVGDSRIEKYGSAVMAILNEKTDADDVKALEP